jgi:methyl-accepting chemotaxis protein
MSLAKFNLGTKLALGFGLVLTFLAVTICLGVSQISDLNVRLDDLVNNKFPKVESASNLIDSVNLTARAVRNIAISDDQNFMMQEKQRIDKARAHFSAEFKKLEDSVISTRGKELLARIKEFNLKVDPLIDKAVNLGMTNNNAEAGKVLFTEVREPQGKLFEAVDALTDYQKDLSHKTSREATQSAASARLFLLILGFVAITIGVIIAYFLTRSITKPVNRIIESLSDGAGQVTSASGQVSAASQQLAEGSSQQAAALEETSSSLEEMSSMTKQNADNAAQANSLMNETYLVVGQANQSMAQLTMSMQEISSASDETAKIIKTIDEIAFQTNLLALNAAVEAARAGEAGAGFAVVADEVRNLAMRAAEAAKNTANLIEGTVAKVKEGSELVHKTAEAFTLVATRTNQAKDLVGEITAASNEQAQGVDQISKAVSEMDKVVQQNAANAEESASASEELSAQAETMKGIVEELASVVQGSQNGNSGLSDVGGQRLQPVHRPAPDQRTLVLVGKGNKSMTTRQANRVRRPEPMSRVVTPEQVIPMEEGDFRSF